MEEKGTDSQGGEYASVNDMWNVELSSGKWYQQGIDYWAGVPATVDGVVRIHQRLLRAAVSLTTFRANFTQRS